MKVRRLPALVWLAPVLVIFWSGCATRHPMVSAWRDAQVTPTRTDKIALALQPNPSRETAELGRLLTAELKQEGFHLVSIDQADYLMAYTLEDQLVDQGRSATTTTVPASPPQTTRQMTATITALPPSPPQPTQQMLGAPLIGGALAAPTIPAKTVSEPIVYRNRGIRLFVYTNPKTHPGGFQIVWQGYIAAGQPSSAERETALIRTLLGYLGREYHGSVNLAQ